MDRIIDLSTYSFSHTANSRESSLLSVAAHKTENTRAMIFEEDSVELSDKAISMMNENPRPGSSEAKKTEEEEKQKKEIEKLKKRDSEVKAHEMAHKSTGGQYAGDIIYEYRTGPDGKRYASGYVNFNLSVE